MCSCACVFKYVLPVSARLECGCGCVCLNFALIMNDFTGSWNASWGCVQQDEGLGLQLFVFSLHSMRETTTMQPVHISTVIVIE